MMSPNCLACLRTIALLVVSFALPMCATRADVVYDNDFDGNVETMPDVGVTISGGVGETDGEVGGVVDSQLYSAVPQFGGDFWRVTTPDDVLQFEFNGVPVGYFLTIEFSLAVIDSWDGSSGAPHGPDLLEIEVLDGATQKVNWTENLSGGATPANNVKSTLVLNQDLGFTQGGAAETWWLDDGNRMRFENIQMDSDTLTFRIQASGTGFVGGTDESFAIDNLLIVAVPEPSVLLPCWGIACMVTCRRRRRNKQ